LAVVKSAVINMGVQMPLLHADFDSFRNMAEVEELGHMGVLVVVSWGTCILISIEVHKLHSHQQGLSVPFPHILASICWFYFLDDSLWLGWNGISGLFWFAFPWWKKVLSIFSYTYWSLEFFNWKVSIQFIYPFTDWIICSFISKFFEFFTYFWILIPCQMNRWQRFLPFCRLSLYFVNCYLCCAEAF
jgi:hypothetical protein